MKRLLLYHRSPDTSLALDLEDRFLIHAQPVFLTTVGSISEAISKSLFASECVQVGYDMFIVSLTELDADAADFIRYVIRYKPELPIVLFSHCNSNWKMNLSYLPERGTNLLEAATKQDLLLQIDLLFVG